MSFCFVISAIVAVDSYCFFTSFVAAYDGITTARVTITISSFRRQNTRKRSLRVTSPVSISEGPRAGSGAPNNTLRTVKPCRTLMALLPLVGRADVVHVHSSKAGFLGRLASLPRRKRRACVFTPHGRSFWAADGGEGRLYAGLERVAAGWCGAIVALSEDERAAGLAQGVGRPELYRVIPNGVDLARFSLPREPVRGRILTVGRLAP